jgi:hypothetical protein
VAGAAERRQGAHAQEAREGNQDQRLLPEVAVGSSRPRTHWQSADGLNAASCPTASWPGSGLARPRARWT